mgnify:CR=1 FL=1
MKKTEITKILNNSRIKIQKAKELLGPLAEQDSPSLNYLGATIQEILTGASDDLSQLSGTIMIEDIDPN